MRRIVATLWRTTVGRSQLLRFIIVGGIGFLVDAGVVSLLVATTELGLYWSRLGSFLCAATATWALNRNFTFRGQGSDNRVREWGMFVAVSIGGAIINYGVYVLTVGIWSLASHIPAIAVAFGSLAGMGFNFPASKHLVFRRAKDYTSVMLDLRRFKPRAGKNRYFVAPAVAIHGEPDRDSPVYALPAIELANALYAVIREEPRIKLIDRTHDGLAMQLIQRSAVFRLPDTIDVEVIALDATQSSVAIYSRSRYGRRDFGVNRRRIERWLAKLAAKIGAGKIIQPENAASPPSA